MTNKDFATLRAAAALQGYMLVRSDPTDGPVTFFLERFGLVQLVRPEQLAQMFAGVVA